MKEPDFPDNEEQRLACLISLNVLDTPPEKRFDNITSECKERFSVPICLVSLVDSDRQWFKSRQGLDACETGRDISFCGHAINYSDILLVEDTLEDYRFKTNPLVQGEPDIRFYAGAPLTINKEYRIGTLCCIDRVPRYFTDEDLKDLRKFADQVERELERNFKTE
ncbi:MAG: GAF domain-containing protein [Alteromonadaceae bacterium]|nr:GAF domain-containing protein [Alteromonadaceae bacterium]